jgi:hypothetical protein
MSRLSRFFKSSPIEFAKSPQGRTYLGVGATCGAYMGCQTYSLVTYDAKKPLDYMIVFPVVPAGVLLGTFLWPLYLPGYACYKYDQIIKSPSYANYTYDQSNSPKKIGSRWA